jgi:hypothetical protein
MPRRIKKAKITHISLVPKGANRMPVIYKAEDETVEFDLLTKMDEQGELVAIVYAPENRDAHGDIASAEVIKEAMYEAARDGVEIDIRHDNKAVGRDRAYVAESFIVQKGDPRFEGFNDYDGNPVDPEGAWGVVIKIEDEALREQYRSGKWNGVSMAGTAVVEAEKSSPEQIAEAVAKRLSRNEDIDMTKDELAALLKENSEAIVAALKSNETAKDEQNTAAADSDAPVFKGDPTDVEAVKAHAEALRKHDLAKSVDWNDAESVAAYLKKIGETEAAAEASTEAASENGADEEIARLERELSRARKASKVRKSDDSAPTHNHTISGMELTKEDHDALAAGSEMAAFANSLRGYKD